MSDAFVSSLLVMQCRESGSVCWEAKEELERLEAAACACNLSVSPHFLDTIYGFYSIVVSIMMSRWIIAP